MVVAASVRPKPRVISTSTSMPLRIGAFDGLLAHKKTETPILHCIIGVMVLLWIMEEPPPCI